MNKFKRIPELDKNDGYIINCILKDLSEKLDDNEIFLSEADFQFSFAQTAKDLSCNNVILEFPIKKLDLYKNKSGATDDIEGFNSYIDIFFEKDRKAYFIELKYKTIETDVKRHKMDFCLKTHDCHTNNRYSVYKDIERLECCLDWYKSTEQITSKKEECIGYAIFLTNYNKHWDPSSNQKEYMLKDKACKDNNEIRINKDYDVKWSDFQKIDDSLFKCAVIEVAD